MTELFKGYEDLYGDAINSVIQLNDSPTYNTIKSYFSDTDEMEREFSYKGKTIIAKRKFTYKGMNKSCKMFQIKTNYLHIWIQLGNSKNSLTHMRESKDGTFKTV